jgi:hypothetical protein
VIPSENRNLPTWPDLILYILVGFGLATGLSFAALEIVDGRLPTLWMTLILTVVNLISLGGFGIGFGLWRRHFTLDEVGLFPIRWDWRWIGYGIGLFAALLPIRSLAAWLGMLVTGQGMESLDARRDMIFTDLRMVDFLVTFVGVGIIAPAAEELFFRGALYRWFRRRYNAWIAIAGTSVLFAAAHFDSVGVVASSLVLAPVLAYTVEKTRSLWAAIALHAINNAAAVILVYASEWFLQAAAFH